MGIQCQILINKAKEGVFWVGQRVSGQVKYIVDEPTEFQHVTLSLIGKGKCVWRRRQNKRTRTYRGDEEYVTHHINICNKKPEDTITLNGEYQYPFEFYLPEDIPRSYKDYYGSIKYRVQLKFEKPSFFSFNTVFKAEIPVYSYITPTEPVGPIIYGLEKTLFSFFATKKPVVHLKAELKKSVVMPGENIHIDYVVTNNTDVEVKGVMTELHCYIKYTANCGSTKQTSDQVKSCEANTASVPPRSTGRFTSVLPTLPDLYSIQHSKIISKKYKICTIVVLPMPHLNGVVEIPVLIGEMKGTVDPTLEGGDAAHPPSYWEAMCEGDKDDDDDDDDEKK